MPNFDEKFMREAYKLAVRAFGDDETPIGCVIERGGKIIARGRNRRNARKNALCHAEIEAIGKACRAAGDWRLDDCTLYVTTEPCPMCAGAIVQARVRRVVYGCANAKAGCGGSVINLLQCAGFNHQVELTPGVLGEECSRLMSDFFKRFRKNGGVSS